MKYLIIILVTYLISYTVGWSNGKDGHGWWGDKHGRP